MMKARHNPFSAQRIDALAYRFISNNWEGLFFKLEQLDYRAAIIGPYGSGKTTLLEQLGNKLRQQGHGTLNIFVNQEFPHLTFAQWMDVLKSSRKNSIILFDGADLLPFWQWILVKLISRRAKGLVIAGHRRLGLPVLIDCQTTLTILDELLHELAGPVDEPLKQAGARLFRQHDGNIREVLRDLYMVCANSENMIQ
jgi:ABC-type branched-subunit amino acid transport system ATPase component